MIVTSSIQALLPATNNYQHALYACTHHHAVCKLTCIRITCNGRSLQRRKAVDGESRAPFQPRFHPDLFDASSRVGEPSAQLREVHSRVVGEVLLLGFSRVRVGLMFLDPFDKNSRVSHSPDGVGQGRGLVMRYCCCCSGTAWY